MHVFHEVRTSIQHEDQEAMSSLDDCGGVDVAEDGSFALRTALHNDDDRQANVLVNVLVPLILCRKMEALDRSSYVPVLPSKSADFIEGGAVTPVRFAVCERTVEPNDVALVDLAVWVNSDVSSVPVLVEATVRYPDDDVQAIEGHVVQVPILRRD